MLPLAGNVVHVAVLFDALVCAMLDP